jgi:hypothetical protein
MKTNKGAFLKEASGMAEHWLEQVIREAQEQGDFANLPGKGKPLNLAEYDPYAGPEAAGYAFLKNAGFTPEWIQWRRQIVDEITWLRANGTHPERPSRIVDVNMLIAKHNRHVPNPTLQLPKLPSDFGRRPGPW